MRAPITVITPTIPGRSVLLTECVDSVYAQTTEVEAHLVLAQSCTEGLPSPVHCAQMQNTLLNVVNTEWTMRLADDDLLLPHHVETLLPYLELADVVYSWDESGNRPRWNANVLSQQALVAAFRKTSWIDGSAVAIRTSWLRKIGGWPSQYEGTPPFHGHFKGMKATCEDWAAFYLLAEAGARFLCVPEETWVYRAGAWPRISMEE